LLALKLCNAAQPFRWRWVFVGGRFDWERGDGIHRENCMQSVSRQRPLLQISDLHAGYENQVVLAGIELSVQRGEWYSLLGPNGVGKSTLLHSIVGYVTPTRGTITINGVATKSLPDALRHVGFACAPEKLPGLLTGRQCLEVYAAAKDLPEVGDALLDLAASLKFMPYLDRYVDTYSLGTRQKLSVLLALLGSPPLIVLDEAFNGLDPDSSLALKRYLRAAVSAGRCGVLLATHALDIVERFSDTAALLINKRIVSVWDRQALEVIRNDKSKSFETELAAAAIREAVTPS
jgi:ABC-2 type transport system ATP-binding protein